MWNKVLRISCRILRSYSYKRKVFSFCEVLFFWTICGTFGLFLDSATAFNLDVEQPKIHRGETGSMFGYAVAQHFDQQKAW